MNSPSGHRPDTTAVRAGRDANGSALAPILWASSTFHAPTVEESHRRATRPRVDDFYGRYGNPGVQAFADAVAELEGAEAGLAFGSGMGAVSSTVLALCSQGSHVVAQRQLFSATHQLFIGVCARFGIDVTMVDGTDAAAIEAAVVPGRTQLVFVETPANPTMAVVDLERVGAITGAITVVDSTFATPILQRPLDFGVDLVLHSATKALAGHNDATLGVIAGHRDLVDWIWGYSTVHGATASPFDAWNGLRGIRTLSVRLRRQSETALALAQRLERDPRVRRVHYPGLAGADLELARAQMPRGFGPLLSFEVEGGAAAAEAVVRGSRLIRPGTSFGGVESSWERRARWKGEDAPEGLIRLSVGIEDGADLARDLDMALAALG